MNVLKTGMLLAAMTALFMGVGWLIGGQQGMLIALVFAAATNLWAWWSSDTMALKAHRARVVGPQDAPDLYRMTAELAERAGLPMPKLAVIDSDQPNAFATGRNSENATVAVTTGLVDSLSREEVAGVIAHELAHIQNRDILIMSVAATVAGAISMLAQFGLFFGGGNRERGGGLGIIGVLLATLLAPLGAMLIQMTISRTREYAADRRGAEICGNPSWLASALQRIAGGRGMMRSAEANPATAHMFIVNPLTGRGVDPLFSTHPSTDNRVRALMEMAREMGQLPAAAPRSASRAASPWDAQAPVGGTRGPARRPGPWR